VSVERESLPLTWSRVVGGLFFPMPRGDEDVGPGRWTLLLAFLGAALACCWLYPLFPLPVNLTAAGLTTGLVWWSGCGGASTGARRSAVVARLMLVGLYLLWGYIAITVGLLLGWTVPWWAVAVIGLAAAGVVYTAVRRRRVRLLLVLPLGLWISACLSGWLHYDGAIRCDDLARVTADPRLRIVVSSSGDLARCSPGQAFQLVRYPRTLWEDPKGGRLVFTTQDREPFLGLAGPEVKDQLDGSICEAPLDGSRRPTCLETGTAQSIVDAEPLDRLLISGWGHFGDDKSGALWALSREAPLRIVRRLEVGPKTGEMYYDPDADVVGLLFDHCDGLLPVRASDFTPGELRPLEVCPGITKYDPKRHEGIFCFGAGPLFSLDGSKFISVAFRGFPEFHAWPLGPSSQSPLAWGGLSWGCDWDRERRRAYVALPALGLLVTTDFDSGAVERTAFVGFGMRSLVLDPQRRLVYLANFLRGEVLAVDAETGAERGRWFVGRFVRQLELSRDGARLLATSTAGIVAISLEGP
jgi:hypothetical protein